MSGRNTDRDQRLMARCIALAEAAFAAGEDPFGSVVARGEEILAEGHSCVRTNRDITAHAEVTAMRAAHQALRSEDFAQYTIYSNFEPCAMCSFMIRELKFGRVVFALTSPAMGGYTKWPILQDRGLSRYCGPPPGVVSGVLAESAAAAAGFARMRAQQGL